MCVSRINKKEKIEKKRKRYEPERRVRQLAGESRNLPLIAVGIM